MDFGTLRLEVASRGFDYLLTDNAGEQRLKRWVNLAYTEVCEQDDWPFLRASTTGSAPLSISDLGSISNVRNSSLDLAMEYRDERDLIDLFGDLTVTGDARWYYLTSESTIAVFPADASSTLKVTYWKVPSELSADSDTPLLPSRYHMAIVEYAVAHAYKDNDNPQAAQVARQEGDRLVQMMRERLLIPSHQGTDFISSLGASVDD